MTAAEDTSAALTTAQAAARLGVAPNSVMNWVDAGLLSAWRTPGGHRRISASSVQAMIEERDKNGAFQSLGDFCSRLDSRSVNRRLLESLVKCGAFDGMHNSRAQLFVDIDPALAAATTIQRDRSSGQGALFDVGETNPSKSTGSSAAPVEPWPRNEMLAYEKELLGYYITGHPLQGFAGHFDNPKVITIAAAGQIIEPVSTTEVSGGCYIIALDIGQNPSPIIRSGQYRDRIVKTAAGWKFDRRTLTLDPSSPAG
jgi:excisionase family DNA binding protein